MGANEVFANCEGWFTVSQSSTIICIDLDNSNILSISAWTSAKLVDLQPELATGFFLNIKFDSFDWFWLPSLIINSKW